MSEDSQTCVIDNGSGVVKAGFSGEDAQELFSPPSLVDPKTPELSLVLKPKMNTSVMKPNKREVS